MKETCQQAIMVLLLICLEGLSLVVFAQLSNDLPAQHERGREIYNFRCYYCHGYPGDAKTLAASFLHPPPRSFTDTLPSDLSREQMLMAVREGKPGTAMKSFRALLSEHEMELVVDFVRREFMRDKAPNTAYHTPENGWPNHERYRIAYPFATGKIPLDRPLERLTEQQRAGRDLFMASCISCHDRAQVESEGLLWKVEALSYPRTGFVPGDFLRPPDAVTGASPFAAHDKPPHLAGLDDRERRGERLFQRNCAFCHGADGTVKNCIGTFLDPHPRDLAAPGFLEALGREGLVRAIENGIPGTSMSAWKNVLSPEQIQALVAYIQRAFSTSRQQAQENAK